MRKRLGVKKIILLMGLLPTLGLSIVLGGFLISSQLQGTKSALTERASRSGEQFAVLASHFMRPLNRQALQDLAISALEEPGLRNIVVYDTDLERLVQAGPAVAPLADLPADSDNLDAPLLSHGDSGLQVLVPIRRYGAEPSLMGWIGMTFSEQMFEVAKYRTLLTGVVFLILALLMSIGLVSYIGQMLRSDFDALRAILRNLIAGNKDFQSHLNGDDEFSDLAERLNQLSTAHQLELQELQRSIEQSNSDLRETLETLEIQNIELDLARREAVNASRVKSEFLANTSHEIRTPLNGILGFTNILLKSELADQQRNAVETIRKSADNLLTIINDILDFSKMEAGKLVFDEAPVDIRELIEDTLLILAPSAYEKKLELALFVDPSIPEMLLSDSLRLRQILTNLVNNAIKFTPAGHVRVNAICNEQTEQDVSLTLQINDSGIGLSAEQQRQIFQDFAQADASITRQYGGTGLGLVIVKGLVEKMGGEVGVESEVGKGSTFWCTLRLPVVKNAIRLRNFSNLADRTVAFYDRNALHAQSIEQLLRHWGMKVEHCDSTENLAHDCDYMLISLGVGEALPTLPAPQAHPFIILTPQPHHYPPREDCLFLHKPVGQIKLYDAFNNRHPGRSNTIRAVFPHLRVLAVDDNPANLHILKSFLDDLQVQRETAQNGVEALQICRDQRFDLILMDIQMPHMDGILCSTEIRRDSLNGETPIVALSAYLAPENPAQLREAGIADFLSKPINERQLLNLLERYAGNLDAPREPVRPVDINECLRLAKGKASLAEEMLGMLFASLPGQARALAAAVEKADHQALAEIQHDLKGACCYTGTPLLKSANLALGEALKQAGSSIDVAVAEVLIAINTLLDWRDAHDLSVIFAR